MNVFNDITDLIGKTPMVKINRLTSKEDAAIYTKLEWYNIGGSVKDRMAKYLLEYAEMSGKLDMDKSILEATSGNTGISLAMLAAVKGYKITIVLPESVSIERRKIIEAYGAKLFLSPGDKGTGGAIELKQKMLEEDPKLYVDIDQFKDPANILAHYHTTGKEILEQTNGRVDMIVVGIGTAGTGVGISKCVKRYNPSIKVVGVTPSLGTRIQGLRNPYDVYPTQLFYRESFDEVIEITEEMIPEIYDVANRAAKEEGLLVGISSAAIIYISLMKARCLGMNNTIVSVLPDSGMKYLSTDLF
jgi:cysteine synthase